MNDVVQLFPEADPERDAAIFKEWRKGTSVQKLSRDYNLPQTQVTAIVDQHLPSLTPKAQVRELRRLLHDLEELRCAYHQIAIAENDPEAANVAVRTTHEIAQLRQFVGGGQHTDPIQLEQRANPKAGNSTDRLLQAFQRLVNDGHASPETKANVERLTAQYGPKDSEDDEDSQS